jgi:hypothetical protein
METGVRHGPAPTEVVGALLLIYGQAYLGHARIVLASDSLMVALFTAYLIGARRS